MLRLIYAIVLLATLQVLKADLLPKDEECGSSPNDKLILEDGLTLIADYPWTVRLQYEKDNSSRFLCGGTLINKRYVITQAYCLNPPGKWKLTGVSVGQSNATFDGTVIVQIEEQIVHEQYSSKNKIPDNDIAMIRLNKNLDFTELTRPICLPKSQEDQINNYNGQELVVTGFGKAYDDDTVDIKKQYTLTAMDNTECTKHYENNKIVIGDGQLCANGVNSFCSGSAGNPLMVQKNDAWMLVGIESTGSPCSVRDFKSRLPTVYTKVGYYTDWILKHLKA